MAIKTNWDVAHSFFYADRNESCCKSWLNISYDGDTCYSYSTVIAKIVRGLDGRKYTLLSYDNMSATTSKHIGNLRGASPYPVIRVPMEYGNSSFDVRWLERRIVDELENYAESRLTRKENRTEYINYYEMLLEVDDKIIKISPETIETYRPLYDVLKDAQSLKELKRNIAETNKRKRDELRKQLQAYIDTYSISQLARLAYDYNYAHRNKVDDYFRKAIKKFINPNKDFAYVWRMEDGSYCTSEGIRMPKEIANSALKRFIAKTIRHGDTLNQYTILSITDKTVRIGCHNIPIENVHDLYETMEQ